MGQDTEKEQAIREAERIAYKEEGIYTLVNWVIKMGKYPDKKYELTGQDLLALFALIVAYVDDVDELAKEKLEGG